MTLATRRPARLGGALLFAACVAFGARAQLVPNLIRTPQKSGTRESLFAISAVNRNIAWASGAHGTFTFTTNGGATWTSGHVHGAEGLELRNIVGVSEVTAYVLTAGPGRLSRIYRTDDGGKHWMPKFTNIDPAIHWRCLSFWGPDHGVAISDAVRTDFVTMSTVDGGWHWDRVSSLALPEALKEERTSATSGTCLFAGRGGHAWFATTKSRVFRTVDYGATWEASYAHISTTDTTGIGSVTFRDRDNGVAFGERASSPNAPLLALTYDGGKTWEAVESRPPISVISAGAYVPDLTGPTLVVVGPQGAAFTHDGGIHWESIDALPYNSVAFSARSAGWAVGASGIITKISF